MKDMKLKDTKSGKCWSDDPLNDLFYGGYINPNDYLIDSDAEKVENAIDTINSYFKILEDNDLIEYG